MEEFDMWSRAQLKGRAKATFKRNYWKCILISLLLTLIAGGSGNYTDFAVCDVCCGNRNLHAAISGLENWLETADRNGRQFYISRKSADYLYQS